jgi:S-(hydroxymethyl)glutathione dehydrogenase/alcohol dehydrogenase
VPVLLRRPCEPQYMGGELKVDEFITHRYPLSEVNEAFHVMHAGESIRAVLDMA